MKNDYYFSLEKVLSFAEILKGKEITSIPYNQEHMGVSSSLGVIEDVLIINDVPAFQLCDDNILILEEREDTFASIDQSLFIFNITVTEDTCFVRLFPH